MNQFGDYFETQLFDLGVALGVTDSSPAVREGKAAALRNRMLNAHNKQTWRTTPPGPSEIFETVEVSASRLRNGGVPET